MAELPWKSFTRPVLDRDYLAILTCLPLKSFSTLPQFVYYTRRIQSQLRSAQGVIGYSLVAHVLTKKFWTLSVWEDEAALEQFVRQPLHKQAMIGLRRYMGDSAFARWGLKGAAVPPGWPEAMEHLPKAARTDYMPK